MVQVPANISGQKPSIKCEHKYVHLETLYTSIENGRYNRMWKRTNRFYCEKCLDEQIKTKSEDCNDKPEWYKE